VGHADGYVAPLQGREEFLARPQCAFGLGLGKERDALVIELQWMVDDVSKQVGTLTVGRHADDVVTGSVARAVMCPDTRPELDGCSVDEMQQ